MLALLAGAFMSAPSSGTPCWRLDVGVPIKMTTEEQRLAVCLEVQSQPDQVLLQVAQDELASDNLCVDVQSIEIVSRKQAKYHKCGTNMLTMPLGPPGVRTSYTFVISTTEPVAVYVEAVDARPPAPPSPPAPSPRARCETAEDNVLSRCASDAHELGCLKGSPSRAEEITCLEINYEQLDAHCRVCAADAAASSSGSIAPLVSPCSPLARCAPSLCSLSPIPVAPVPPAFAPPACAPPPPLL